MEARMMNIVFMRPFAMLFIVTLAACFLATPSQSQAVVKGAYYPSWDHNNFPPSSINTTLFTHIYYAFLTPNTHTFKLDVTPVQAILLLSFTSTLKLRGVRTLFSVNGDPSLFARLAADPTSRAAFIASSITVSRGFGFDGVDLDWKYPQSSTEMDNFGRLLDEWRVAVQWEASATGRPPLLLTAAVFYSNLISWPTTRSYPAASVNNNLDWVNVRSFDYAGSWDRPLVTGAHAALYNPRSDLSTSYGMDAWIGAGVASGKLVMGLPLYGRTWQLEDPGRARGIGAPAVGSGPGVDGAMTYADVVRFNTENNAEVVYDPETVSVYSVAGSSWISYDDPRSLQIKVDYVQLKGLRGTLYWMVDDDNN